MPTLALLLAFAAALLVAPAGLAQTAADTTKYNPIWEIDEDPPELVGGLSGLAARLQYPAFALDEGLEGKVFIRFVVDAGGSVLEPECARAFDDRLCDAAIDAVRASTFLPGRQRGQPVAMTFSLPVTFARPDAVDAQAPLDSAAIERVLDGMMLETTFDAFEMSSGATPQGATLSDVLTLDALRDSVRAQLVVGFQPEWVTEILGFYETPAYQSGVVQMQEMQNDPERQAEFVQRVMSGEGPRADSALTARYLAATGTVEMMAETQRRLFGAILDSIPEFRDAYATMASSSGVSVDSLVHGLIDATTAGMFEAMRMGLAETPEDDIRAVIAFNETPAGAHLSDASAEGTLRAMVPAALVLTRQLVAGPPPAPPPPMPIQAAPGDTAEDPDLTDHTMEDPPVLIGGLEGLMKRVVYPESARRDTVEGRVFVQFIVDELGAVIDPTCVHSPDPRLCDAAIAAVGASSFEPAEQRGRPVAIRYSLPVDFVLRDHAPPAGPAGRGADVYATVDTPPEILKMGPVDYPEDARRAGDEGKVYVQFVVDVDGAVLGPVCPESPSDILCQAALRAARRTTFTPGRHEGRPVKVLYTMPVNFKLR